MSRILGLDILRTIAILQVVLVHSTYVFPENVKILLLKFIPAIDGVSIFFVLSGFLIGKILLKIIESTSFSLIDLGNFWIRRWFRTLPNYFIIVIFLYIYDLLIYHVDSGFSIRYIFFVQNLDSNHPDFFPEAWSLAIEEWFYFLFPIICFIGIRFTNNKKSVFIYSTIFFLIGPLVLRLMLSYSENVNLLDVRKIIIYRLDSLMYGMIGAYIYRYHLDWWNETKILGLWIFIFVIFILSTLNLFNIESILFWKVYSFNIESIGTLAALPFFNSISSLRFSWIEGVFNFISKTSYSMYVLNLSVIQWRIVPALISVVGLRPLDGKFIGSLSFIFFWIVLFIGSYFLYRFYEQPMLNLRDKIRLKPE